MISSKKLTRKWQKMAGAAGRIRTSQSTNKDLNIGSCNSLSVNDKGRFVIYTMDQRRFTMPLAYLSNNIVQELFKMSEEEFGLSSDGPIIFPCDGMFMEYIVLLIERGVAKDFEKALINSITTSCCSLVTSSDLGYMSQHLLVHGY